MVQLKPGVGLIGSTDDTTGAPLPLVFRSRAEDIVREHTAAERCAAKAIEHAAECGRSLVGLKEDLDRGEFIPFIEEHLPFTRQTASGYMRIANAIDTGKLEMESASSIRGALKQLSAPAPKLVQVPDEPTVEPGGDVEILPPAPTITPPADSAVDVKSISSSEVKSGSAEAEAKEYIKAYLAEERLGPFTTDIQEVFEARLPESAVVDGEVRQDLADAYEPLLQAIDRINAFIHEEIGYDEKGIASIEYELALILPLLSDDLDGVGSAWVGRLEEIADTAGQMWRRIESDTGKGAG